MTVSLTTLMSKQMRQGVIKQTVMRITKTRMSQEVRKLQTGCMGQKRTRYGTVTKPNSTGGTTCIKHLDSCIAISATFLVTTQYIISDTSGGITCIKQLDSCIAISATFSVTKQYVLLCSISRVSDCVPVITPPGASPSIQLTLHATQSYPKLVTVTHLIEFEYNTSNTSGGTTCIKQPNSCIAISTFWVLYQIRQGTQPAGNSQNHTPQSMLLFQ